jgi:flavin reductase (DIM6/NTAB) family NADH-FMN oxidoreductase RutF
MSFDPKQLRSTLGRFATGVTVITTSGDGGEPVGFTANSFTSVSLDPALVLFCIARSVTCHDAFASGSHFAIHMLGESQKPLSNRFASRGEDRFRELDHAPGVGGVPVISGCLAHLQCETERVLDGGDHSIVVGKVVDFKTEADEHPLIYFGGGYRELVPVSV